ncbi:MAG: hypothetical protein R3E87_18150 [Burkholderiaceae bacterium]
MQILQPQDLAGIACHALQQRAKCRERALGEAHGVRRLQDTAVDVEVQQLSECRSVNRQPICLHRAAELLAPLLGARIVAQAEQSAQAGGQKAVGLRAANARLHAADGIRAESLPREKLEDQPRLADPGLALDEGRKAARSIGLTNDAAQQPEFDLSTDERRQAAGRADLEGIAWQESAQHTNALRFTDPFDDHALPLAEHDIAIQKSRRGIGYAGLTRLGKRLHSRCDVCRRPDRADVQGEVILGGPYRYLAGMQADSRPRQPIRFRQMHSCESFVDACGGGGGTKSVRLVGKRRAEHGHDAVAKNLRHHAVERMDGLDHRRDQIVEGAGTTTVVLRGHPSRRVGNVDEHHRGELQRLVQGGPTTHEPGHQGVVGQRNHGSRDPTQARPAVAAEVAGRRAFVGADVADPRAGQPGVAEAFERPTLGDCHRGTRSFLLFCPTNPNGG